MKRMINKLAISVGFLVAGLLLPCSSVYAAEHVKVGYLPVTGHAKFFVAKEQGLFAKEGIDAELVEFINSADGLAAVRAGKVDVGAFGTTAPLVHIAQGADLKVIGGIMGEDASIITKPETAPKIKSIADLKGKKIATVRLATGDAVLRGALRNSGINWKTDVEIFELKNPPAVMEAVKSGQVDAGVTWGPHDVTAEKEGLSVVIRSRSLEPGHPCCRLVITDENYQKRKDLWVRFIKALLRAEKFAQQDQQATLDAIGRYVKLDRAINEKAYYHGYLDQSTDPNVKGVKEFWKTMQHCEFVKSQKDISPHIDATFYDKALKDLEKENPADPFWKDLRKTFVARNL
jgi:NitT/TauT family transport system substrate-binding protein